MRPFIAQRKTANGEEVGIKTTNSYIECEYHINEEVAYVVYIIRRNENSAWVAASFEDTFDELLRNPDRDTFETIANTYPTLHRLICNGMSNRYQKGGLVVLEDTDYCEKKWFVASIVGNISFKSVEDLCGERMQEAIDLVISTSMELWVELNENKPNTLWEFGKGFLKGVGIAATAAVLAFLDIEPE